MLPAGWGCGPSWEGGRLGLDLYQSSDFLVARLDLASSLAPLVARLSGFEGAVRLTLALGPLSLL